MGGAVGGFEFVDHRITVALNVLSWLCDGQKREMQDILRKQKLFAVRYYVCLTTLLNLLSCTLTCTHTDTYMGTGTSKYTDTCT